MFLVIYIVLLSLRALDEQQALFFHPHTKLDDDLGNSWRKHCIL